VTSDSELASAEPSNQQFIAGVAERSLLRRLVSFISTFLVIRMEKEFGVESMFTSPIGHEVILGNGPVNEIIQNSRSQTNRSERGLSTVAYGKHASI
jgi:hypothetical protein